ncbi:DUF1772 domain-containing protein [Flindersiella endophytica]
MRATRTLLTLAQLGRAHWLFGNLYEAVARIPERLSEPSDASGADPRPASMLGKGSPARYYLPGIPVTFGATIAALATGWKAPAGGRGWLIASTASTLAGAAVTVHLVRNVNSKLFVAGPPLSAEERQALLKKWHRLNACRLAAAAAGMLTAERARGRR